jgi:translation initiation factor IF-2
MDEKRIGVVFTFFAKPVVAGIKLEAPLKAGDTIHIKGFTTDMEFVVESMQINNKNVPQAKKGNSIGIKVTDKVRPGDIVYKK